jgi:uncharacterized protein YacL
MGIIKQDTNWLALLLSKRKQKKPIRNVELESVEEEEDSKEFSFWDLPLGRIIGGFIIILISVSLMPTISEQVNLLVIETNMTGASETLLSSIPLFFGLVIAVTAVVIAISSLRNYQTL